MNKLIIIISLALLASCQNNIDEADAWGNFEATETMIASQTNGQLVGFYVSEGDKVQKGTLIAQVDTQQFLLKQNELVASKQSIATRVSSVSSQNEILKQQISNLKIDKNRIANMLKDGASTQKQYDDIVGQILLVEKHISANNSQKSLIISELTVLDSKIAQINNQISMSKILSPADGVMVQKYAEKGEITAVGKPIARIANLNNIKLKVYVSGSELANVLIGYNCIVRIDKGDDEFFEYTGKIVTVSDKAEFTPKIIQTKEERVSMVYAVTIRVANDGKIKSGMPGEAIFTKPE